MTSHSNLNLFNFRACLRQRGSRDGARLFRKLCEQQNHRCCYCGVRTNETSDSRSGDAPTIEHVIKREFGGSDRMYNLVMACAECNKLRSSMHPRDSLGVAAMMLDVAYNRDVAS